MAISSSNQLIFENQLRGTAAATLLLSGTVGLGYLVGGFTTLTLFLSTVFTMLVTGATTYWSREIVFHLHGVKVLQPDDNPSNPDLKLLKELDVYRIVNELGEKHDISTAGIIIGVMPGEQPNAFATGRSRNHAGIAISKGLLDRIRNIDQFHRKYPAHQRVTQKDLLKAIFAHELGHVVHQDVRITGALSVVSLLFIKLSHAAYQDAKHRHEKTQREYNRRHEKTQREYNRRKELQNEPGEQDQHKKPNPLLSGLQLAFFGFLFSSSSFLTKILTLFISRKQELSADDCAVAHSRQLCEGLLATFDLLEWEENLEEGANDSSARPPSHKDAKADKYANDSSTVPSAPPEMNGFLFCYHDDKQKQSGSGWKLLDNFENMMSSHPSMQERKERVRRHIDRCNTP